MRANLLSEGWFTTTLAAGEVLAETLIPIRPRGAGRDRRAGRADTATSLLPGLHSSSNQAEGGDVVERAGIAAFGVGSTPIRLGDVEDFLAGRDSMPRPSTRRADELPPGDDPTEDVHASADYRREAREPCSPAR